MRPTIEYPPCPNGNNGGFCEDIDPPWAWTYSSGRRPDAYSQPPVGNDPCGERIAILAGTWTTGARMTKGVHLSDSPPVATFCPHQARGRKAPRRTDDQ